MRHAGYPELCNDHKDLVGIFTRKFNKLAFCHFMNIAVCFAIELGFESLLSLNILFILRLGPGVIAIRAYDGISSIPPELAGAAQSEARRIVTRCRDRNTGSKQSHDDQQMHDYTFHGEVSSKFGIGRCE